MPAPADSEQGVTDFLALKVGAIWLQMKAEPAYFWLLCGYFFVEYVRPQSVYPALDILPWGKLCLLGALGLRMMSSEPRSIKNPLTFTSVGFFIAALLSSVLAYFPSASFDRFAAFLNWVILYFVVIWIVTTRFRLYMIVLVLMACSFKMSQHGAIVWVRRGLTFEFYGITGGPGYFGNAADLGVQMLIFVPLSLAFVLGCRQYWGLLKQILFVLMPISAVMTVIATGERGTLLGLATMGLVMVAIGRQKFRKLLIIAFAGFLVFQLMPERYLARFETAGTDGTSQARLRYWARGIQMFQENPVFGIGFNNWQAYYSQRFPGESLRAGHQEVAHSTPITVLTEMGLLGFVFFYGMALMTLVANRRTLQALKDSTEPIYWRYLALSLSIGLFGFLAASCFVTEHEFPFLFVQACLSAAMYNIFVGGPNASQSTQRGLSRGRA